MVEGKHEGKRNSAKKNPNEFQGDNQPMANLFREYAKELDDKHDRYERIVKLSRDITIESKRIIFLLHTICPRKNNKEKILAEAWNRLQKLINTNFLAIAKELIDQDIYQYKWAFSGGLQEFVEAYSFHQYLQGDKSLVDWNDLQEMMTYKCCDESTPKEKSAVEVIQESKDVNAKEMNVTYCQFFVEPTEFLLGVADLTGEIMRKCINSLGGGDTATTFECCKTLQYFYKEYVAINAFRCKEMSRKIYTMRQSVLKTETVCYNVRVRGGEAAKWGTVYDSNKQDDLDEGFY